MRTFPSHHLSDTIRTCFVPGGFTVFFHTNVPDGSGGREIEFLCLNILRVLDHFLKRSDDLGRDECASCQWIQLDGFRIGLNLVIMVLMSELATTISDQSYPSQPSIAASSTFPHMTSSSTFLAHVEGQTVESTKMKRTSSGQRV